jgi:hypothetical protein
MSGKFETITKTFSKLTLLPEYLAVTARQASKKLPANAKQIVFTLDDVRLYSDNDGMGRHAYLLLNAFHDAGYNVYLHKKVGFWAYTRLGRYGRFLYELEHLKVISSLPANTADMIYAFDTVYPDLVKKPWKKRSFVNILKDPSCRLGEVVPIPFSMHPIWYRSKGNEKAVALRTTKRTLRMIFGGNTSTESYSNPYFKNYNQLPRAEGLKAAYTLKQIRPITSKEEVDALYNGTGYLNEGRILSTNDKSVGVENRWLELIAKSDFFLCFSGTDLPMCHNAIESMAVGTIPIISYGHWFYPNLEHMKNAIVYSDAADFVRKLTEVFAMDENAIERLRKGVLEYYDTHLGGKNFVRKYEQQNDKENTMMLYPLYIPRHWELPKSQKTLSDLKEYFGAKAGGGV